MWLNSRDFSSVEIWKYIRDTLCNALLMLNLLLQTNTVNTQKSWCLRLCKLTKTAQFRHWAKLSLTVSKFVCNFCVSAFHSLSNHHGFALFIFIQLASEGLELTALTVSIKSAAKQLNEIGSRTYQVWMEGKIMKWFGWKDCLLSWLHFHPVWDKQK